MFGGFVLTRLKKAPPKNKTKNPHKPVLIPEQELEVPLALRHLDAFGSPTGAVQSGIPA